MTNSEEKTILTVNTECCPVTNVFNVISTEKAKLLIELGSIFDLKLIKEWVINPEMREHLNACPIVMLSEVHNYSLELDPSEADRTGRSMSLLIKDFLDFFYDIELPKLQYIFVSVQVYELIYDKYFN